MRRLALPLLVLTALTLGACVTAPPSPSVMVLPGPGKPFEVFQTDDSMCRQWALQQSGAAGTPSVGQSTAAGGVIGTLIGGAIGAAIGAAAGNPAMGAAAGAGFGLIGGTATGASAGSADAYAVQRRYDVAYQQCMYSRGNQIPGVRAATPARYVPPPPPPPPPPAATGQYAPPAPSTSAGQYAPQPPYAPATPTAGQYVTTPPPDAVGPPPGTPPPTAVPR